MLDMPENQELQDKLKELEEYVSKSKNVREMNLADIVKEVQSGVVHIIHATKNAETSELERAASGTGFIVKGRLVTNYHVIHQCPENSVVVIRTYDSPAKLSDCLKLNHDDLVKRTITASDEQHCDYVVLDIPELKEKDLYNFSLASYKSKQVGDSILFLGYPFEHLNLVCHAGIISSIYKSNNSIIDTIQVDASVNPSNSGGPLIDPETGNVIGIITRKATGLHKTFEELRSILQENIDIISSSTSLGMMSIGGVDPVQGIIASQSQILQLTHHIERSANVGIGYAFSVEELMNENFYVV